MTNPLDQYDPQLEADLTSVPPPPTVPSAWDAIAKFVADRDAALTPEQNKAAAQAIARRYAEAEVDRLLLSDASAEEKLTRLTAIAQEYDDPTVLRAQAAMVEALRAQEPAPPTDDPAQRILAQREANAAMARAAAAAFSAELKGKRFGAPDAAGVVRSLIVPDFFVHLGNTFRRIDPEVDWSDYVRPEDWQRKFRERVLSAEPEQARQLVKAFVDAAREEGSAIWLDKGYVAGSIVEQVLGGIDPDNKATWDNVWPALELLSVVPPLKWVKGAISRIGLTGGSVAHSAAETKAGADALLKASHTEEALAQAGVRPEQVAGSLVLPTNGPQPASGLPALLPNYIPDNQKPALAKAAEDVARAAFGTRLNDSSLRFTDDGVETLTRVGKGDGTPYATEAAAKRALAANPEFKGLGGRIVPVGVDTSRPGLVRAPDGTPLTLYHGTNVPQDFTTFKASGYKTGADSAAEGVFFTSNPRVAENYAANIGVGGALGLALGGVKKYVGNPEFDRLMAGVEATRKAVADTHAAAIGKRARAFQALIPDTDDVLADRLARSVEEAGVDARIPPRTSPAYEEALKANAEAEAALNRWVLAAEAAATPQRLIPVHLSIKNPKVYDAGGKTPADFSLTDKLRAAKAAGHDGVIFKNLKDPVESADHYVVFDPAKQVQFKLSGGFLIEYAGKAPLDLNAVADARLLNPVTNKWWGRILGKAVGFSDFLVQSSNLAAIKAGQVERIVRDHLKPLYSLRTASKGRVYDILRQHEDKKSLYADDLRALGLNEAEVAAGVAVRNVLDWRHAIKNENVRTMLVSRGFGSTARIKGVGEAIVLELKELPAGAKVLNASTGKAARGFDPKKHRAFRLFEETPDGVTHIIVPINDASRLLADLPAQVLAYRPGHLMRLYRAPLFIKEFLGDGRVRTLHTAPDTRSAQQWLDNYRAANPQANVDMVPAQEIAGRSEDAIELEQLREAGLMYNSHRRYTPLTDVVTGQPELASVQESLQAAINSTVHEATIKRWAMAMGKMWENTYGHLELGSFSLARRPQRLVEAGRQAEVDEALQVYDFVRAAAGLHPEQLAAGLRGWRNSIADVIYRVPGIGRFAGNELVGLTHKTTDVVKSLAASAYLFLNPVRSAIMQMTMIPTYLGVRGGTAYAASGRFFRDLAILSAGRTFGVGRAAAQRVGVSAREADELLDQFEKSGLVDLVDSHIFTVGTIVDTRTAQTGPVGELVQRVVNAVKRHGFDRGLRADKRAAWLFARERWLVDNGRLPSNQKEWDDVAAFAEQLTLNQNRTDVPFSQHGVLSVFTQFMSHQLKMTGRLLTALPGTKAEAGFAKSELRRMAVYSLLTYGTSGYGITELVQQFEAVNGPLPDEVRLALHEGLGGYVVNAMLALLADEGEDATRVAFSGSFSPTNFIGNGPKYVAAMVQEILGWDTTALDRLPDPISSAGLGLAKDIAGVVAFAYKLGGRVAMPAEDVALATTAEFFRRFPLINNTAKMMLALNTGIAVDSRGNPVTRVSRGEAIAAIIGARSHKELQVGELYRELYGAYQEADQAKLVGALREDARNMAGVVERALRNLNGGTVPVVEVEKLITEHAIAMNTALPRVYRDRYYAEFRDALLKSDVLKQERMEELIMQVARQGGGRGVTLDESFVRRIERMYDFPNKKHLLEFINNIMRVVYHDEQPED